MIDSFRYIIHLMPYLEPPSIIAIFYASDVHTFAHQISLHSLAEEGVKVVYPTYIYFIPGFIRQLSHRETA